MTQCSKDAQCTTENFPAALFSQACHIANKPLLSTYYVQGSVLDYEGEYSMDKGTLVLEVNCK